MAGLAEDRDHLGERAVDVDRLDVGARHHHVLDAHVAELQDGAQHGALVGGERRAGRFVGGDGVLDLGARGAVRRSPSALKSAALSRLQCLVAGPRLGRRAVGTSTLVVAHCLEAAA